MSRCYQEDGLWFRIKRNSNWKVHRLDSLSERESRPLYSRNVQVYPKWPVIRNIVKGTQCLAELWNKVMMLTSWVCTILQDHLLLSTLCRPTRAQTLTSLHLETPWTQLLCSSFSFIWSLKARVWWVAFLLPKEPATRCAWENVFYYSGPVEPFIPGRQVVMRRVMFPWEKGYTACWLLILWCHDAARKGGHTCLVPLVVFTVEGSWRGIKVEQQLSIYGQHSSRPSWCLSTQIKRGVMP